MSGEMKTEAKEESLMPSSEDEENSKNNGNEGDDQAIALPANGIIKEEVGVAMSPKDEPMEECSSNQCVERYKCHHCEKSYKNLRSLNQHFREVQVCRVCKKSFEGIEEFTSHILEDHTVGALCGVCMISFRSRARLVEHVRTHTQLALKKPDVNRVRAKRPNAEVSSRWCKLCRAEMSPLAPHTCHANVCKVCRKPLRTRNEFEVHMMRLHCTEDTCQFCMARLPTLQHLISHLKSHTSLRFPSHKCLKCGLRFNNALRLAGHECQSQHMSSPPPSPSKGSVSQTNSPSGAMDKSNIFSPEKNSDSTSSWPQGEEAAESHQEDNIKHNCEWCNKKFKLLKDLKQHKLEIHTCRFCKKTLRTQMESERHLMEEHSSKDECQFCMRKFVCTTALRTHLKIHTTLAHQLYQCKKCSQRFSNLKMKARHKCLNISCFFCHQNFSSDADQEYHIMSFHPDKCVLNCNTCSKKFISRQALKKHIQVKHK